jgi:hypothetical protein
MDYSFPASMEAPSSAPPFGARRGSPPARWRTSALITIWATLKLPQCSRLMEASGELRWAALGDWTSWSDGCYLGANSEDSEQSCGRIEPDVHLIKQVEQVTTPALEGPTWASPGFRALGGTDA